MLSNPVHDWIDERGGTGHDDLGTFRDRVDRFPVRGPRRQTQESLIEGSRESNVNTRVTCTTIGETGSRLARRRVCMTHAQWQESQRRNRQIVEEAQLRQIAPTELVGIAATQGAPAAPR